jgi:hypothetical protein
MSDELVDIDVVVNLLDEIDILFKVEIFPIRGTNNDIYIADLIIMQLNNLHDSFTELSRPLDIMR